ncbi:MAG TPA: hypothetical protein VFM37_11295 [Pseudonocardiaceae bacterium]|nr:hypothetical protein [Pseudonocardiaceae bacterium]
MSTNRITVLCTDPSHDTGGTVTVAAFERHPDGSWRLDTTAALGHTRVAGHGLPRWYDEPSPRRRPSHVRSDGAAVLECAGCGDRLVLGRVDRRGAVVLSAAEHAELVYRAYCGLPPDDDVDEP